MSIQDTVKRIIHYTKVQNKYVKTIIVVLLLTVILALVQVNNESEIIIEEKHEIELQAARNIELEKKIREEKSEIEDLKAEVSEKQESLANAGLNGFDANPVLVAEAVSTTDESDQEFQWVSWGGNENIAGLHVVITSFCIGQGLEELHVDARMHMFRSITVPTMRAQQSQNFLWLIFIDDTLREDVVSEIHSLIGGHKNFKVVQRREGKWRGPHYGTDAFPQLNSVNKMLMVSGVNTVPPPDDKAPLIVTTRLDSDDGLHPSATLEIQQAAIEWDESKQRLPGFVCWNQASLWMANGENALGALGTDTLPYGPETGCLPSGVSMFTHDVDQRSVFWEGHTQRIRNLTINNMRERLGDRLKVLRGNLENDGTPSNDTPMNVPIRARTVTGVGVLGLTSSAVPTLLSHAYDKYKRGLELSYPQMNLKTFEEMNSFFVNEERAIIKSTLGIKCVSVPGATCNPKTKSRVRSIEATRPDVGGGTPALRGY